MMKRITILAALLMAIPAGAQEPPVPASVQLAVFAKVWTLDRSFRGNGHVEMIVAYQSGYRASAIVREQISAAAAAIPILRCHFVDLDGTGPLETLIPASAHVLYVAPLRSFELSRLTGIARARGLRTVTGVEAYVSAGVAVGLTVRNDRPLILVNLEAARAEGSQFSAQLLKLARIVEPAERR